MTKSALPVDGEQLQRDIEQIASFGAVDADDGRGRTALPGDEANGEARDYLVARLEEAGLDVRVDAVGNIAGRWMPPSADPNAAAIAAGSHLDSVPRGGIFDGPLGVFAALEAVRAIRESDVSPDCGFEVVCFTGEEGTRFADGVLGSTVATGKRGVDETLALTDGNVTFEEALERIGYRGTGRLDASEWDAWLELHIEQNSRLEDARVPLGVVTDITGTVRCHVTIEGEADHSGTTAMTDRQDALAAASELVLAVERSAIEAAASGSGTAVGTVGHLDVEPSVVNVVPGTVSMRLDLRSVERTEIQAQLDAVTSVLEAVKDDRHVSTTFDCTYDVPPTPLSAWCRDTVLNAAQDCDVEARTLHSGAGHDTMQVADVTNAALLFAASVGGHSHSPKEWADWDDCTAATTVLAESLAQLATTDEH
ncbi:Zn-dependent hydrolase [Natrialba taiwanensis]|uniref:Amidase, hydantoinase/carbamoylase family protein n=1 Tax=Natrialba taiwanensis DSM 12281 TaxID=1230458 RepID=L9ZIM3_9EURY|nr:Zn-dependent hydrolase [Natrialba taiwanensis]ELY86214.1 amidase, hydantoinase/carbamoylase family protein [Natrialba taiwanensis DSM 12281]